ncbi:MAG: trypsin-like peptidase domain-containing protein [Candidatus Calescibacterium sp.]|nr:trypsin-like peptidase domain-containing protein [Candidatus Calescibacterium sp.]MCX7972012.1 trypsin-like peptidase domain-containing protein [bacterium]MDW8194704.1 trypsin-like peptidase domain-containing protein [Candidatus Calescibacterium sp.]
MQNKLIITILLIIIAIQQLIITTNPKKAYSDHEEKVINAIEKVKKSVVRIDAWSSEGKPKELGSGIVFSSQGHIITNAHVVKDTDTINVTFFDGKKKVGVLIDYSDQYDIAVLKVDPTGLNIVPAEFGDATKLRLGQTVIAVGNPLNFGWTCTIGIVSGLNRNIRVDNRIYEDLIQTDAAINRGNSGGALVNLAGQVVGINTLVYRGRSGAEGMGFAITSNKARYVANDILKGRVLIPQRAWLGIEPIEITPQLAEKYALPVNYGIYVKSVFPDGPADKHGITPGDIIIKIDDKIVDSVAKFNTLIESKKPGEYIKVTVYSGNVVKVIKVKLEVRSR